MRRKDKTVSLIGLQPEMRIVLEHIEKVYAKYGKEGLITAGTEAFDSYGKLIHSVGSLHPFGYALDFRTNFFQGNEIGLVAYELRNLLGKDYDVVIHKTHLHIEYQKH